MTDLHLDYMNGEVRIRLHLASAVLALTAAGALVLAQ
jgi:hypothetical protein